MAPVKLTAAALAVVVVLVCAATMTTPATAWVYQPEPEDCKTQATYFTNCLRYGLHENCCIRRVDAAGRNCYCEVQREAAIQCVRKQRCPRLVGIVKVAEMHLSCMKKEKLLDCNRA